MTRIWFGQGSLLLFVLLPEDEEGGVRALSADDGAHSVSPSVMR